MLHQMGQGIILLTLTKADILHLVLEYMTVSTSLPGGFLPLEQASRMGSPKSPGSSSPLALILSFLSWFYLHQNKAKIKMHLLYLPLLQAIYLSKTRKTCLW